MFNCFTSISQRFRGESRNKLIFTINRSSTHNKIMNVSYCMSHINCQRSTFSVVKPNLDCCCWSIIVNYGATILRVFIHCATKTLDTAQTLSRSWICNIFRWSWWSELWSTFVLESDTNRLVVFSTKFFWNISFI